MANANIQHQLSSTLQTQYSIQASAAWLSSFLASARQPLPPLPALTSTARFRILASDIKVSLAPGTTVLPVDINEVSIKERRLSTDVVVQVLDITDIGTSKWSQIEAIERIERGEEVRGREVIRSVPIMNEDDDADAMDGGGGSNARNRARGGDGNAQTSTANGSSKKSPGPHNLVLQDANGTNVTGFEMVELLQVYIGEGGMSIGCKLLLKQGALVRRGMVMLMPDSVTVMGGKIESWDKKWRDDRKKRLIADIDAMQATGNSAG